MRHEIGMHRIHDVATHLLLLPGLGTPQYLNIGFAYVDILSREARLD